MDEVVIPRYRIEHREPGLSALIVASAATLKMARLTVARKRIRLQLSGAKGVLVIVDQEHETDVKTFELR